MRNIHALLEDPIILAKFSIPLVSTKARKVDNYPFSSQPKRVAECKSIFLNLAITLQAVNYSRYDVQRMVTLEARWGTTGSIRLHNSIGTAFSVSAIQYTPDPLFSIIGAGKRRRENRIIHVLSIPSAFSHFLVRTMGENRCAI